MNRTTALRIAAVLMGLPALGHLGGYLPATMEHVMDATWRAHARFHAFQSVVFIVGWDLVVMWIVLGSLQRSEKWTLWVLLAYLIFVQGGYFISMAVIPEGTPPEMIFNIMFVI